jgi:hypothetical protein
MAMGGESRETVIVAKAPEEVTKTEMTTAACKVGSVLISKKYFMPMQDDKGVKRARAQKEGTRRVNRDDRFLASSSPWFVGVGKNL